MIRVDNFNKKSQTLPLGKVEWSSHSQFNGNIFFRLGFIVVDVFFQNNDGVK